MKNIKIITLAIITLSQVFLVSAMDETPAKRFDRKIRENLFEDKFLGLVKK